MAACSSDEIESVALKGNGMMPLEIVTDVANQTRAAQITASNVIVSEPTGDAGSVTADLGTPMLVMPQNFTAQDLTADTWTAPYISVLARISSTSGNAIYPKNAGENDYAWVALPLPADFTGFQAHHKYIFTLNFRSDALGKVDRDQDPNDDGGDDNTDDLVPEVDKDTDITPTHSGFELGVTITDVLDFDQGGDYNVDNTHVYPTLSSATSDDIGKVVCAAGHLHEAKTEEPAACTAVGILGKVTETGHGLIIALHDAQLQTWRTIRSWETLTQYAGTTLYLLPDNDARGTKLTSYTTLGTTTVSNWAVGMHDDYNAIFINLGSTKENGANYTYDDNVNAFFTTGVYGSALSGKYWSASELYNDGWGFYPNYWASNFGYIEQQIRPVLGF